MNWDDLRFVLALANVGSLAATARTLGVDHTTVGRRVAVAEEALGVKLFTRTKRGYVPTSDAVRLLAPMRQVEQAILAVERQATCATAALEGAVRVTTPETLGMTYLAPRLAAFGLAHPGLTIELLAAGEVLDLGRREAEVAVRGFRSKEESLVARRVAVVAYGFYASADYLSRRPLRGAHDLAHHPILTCPKGPNVIEAAWLARIAPTARPTFVSTLSTALLAAAQASSGVAVLPRYVGDAEPSLRHLPMGEEPTESLWLTVHRDLRRTPRVRAVLDHIATTMKNDASMFRGRAA